RLPVCAHSFAPDAAERGCDGRLDSDYGQAHPDSHWRRQDLPGSWRTPMQTRPALRPRRVSASPLATLTMLPAAIFTTSAPAMIHISRLHHAARVLPVYASQARSPSHHATLGSGWS